MPVISDETLKLLSLIITILSSLGAAVAFITKTYLTRFLPKSPDEQLALINKHIEKESELSEPLKSFLKERLEFYLFYEMTGLQASGPLRRQIIAVLEHGSSEINLSMIKDVRSYLKLDDEKRLVVKVTKKALVGAIAFSIPGLLILIAGVILMLYLTEPVLVRNMPLSPGVVLVRMLLGALIFGAAAFASAVIYLTPLRRWLRARHLKNYLAENAKARALTTPQDKLRELFEDVLKLQRVQQEEVINSVSAFITQHRQ